MSKITHQALKGRTITLPFWVLGIAGLLLLWVFLIDGSTVFAQDAGDEDHRDSQEDRGDSPFTPDLAQVECFERVLGRAITGPDDINTAEQRLIAQECLGGIRGGDRTGGSRFSEAGDPGDRRDGNGGLDQQTIECIIATVGRTPTHEDEFTDEEKRLVGQQCFAGRFGGEGDHRDRQDGPGDLDDATIRCIESTVGRRLGPGFEPTDEEKRLIGAACFGGRAGGREVSDGPGDLDEATIRCIESTIGRRLGPGFEPTDEEKRLIGAACFGDHGGGPGGSDGPDAATRQCIQDTIGRLPADEFDLTDEEKILLGPACFGEDVHDVETLRCIVDTLGYLPDGSEFMTDEEKILIGQACFSEDVPDEETLRCIVDTLGYLPDGPEFMTDDERLLVGRACFGGHGPEGDIDTATMECIVDILGFLPSGSDELTDDQRRLLGRECFGDEDSDDLNDVERQCVIDTLGYLPDSPDALTDEEMDLVIQACFADEHEDSDDLDPATQQCIIDILGFLPESEAQVSEEDKRRVGRECFGGGNGGRDDDRRGPGTGGLSEALQQCILNTVGFIPTDAGDLTVDQRRQIGQECFERQPRPSRVRPTGGDTSSSSGQPSGGDTGGQQAAATGGDQAAATGGQPDDDSSGQQPEATGGQPSPADQPGDTVPQPAVRALSQAELQIRDLIVEHNILIEEMEAVGVIGRLQNLRGSLTSAIQVLSVVNDLVVKGRVVTDAEFLEVFDELRARDIDLDNRN